MQTESKHHAVMITNVLWFWFSLKQIITVTCITMYWLSQSIHFIVMHECNNINRFTKVSFEINRLYITHEMLIHVIYYVVHM